MMKYFYAVNEEREEVLYSIKEEVVKDDLIVVPSYYDEDAVPEIVIVTKNVSELKALTSRQTPVESIQKVDMREHKAKMKKAKENAILFDKMQLKINEIKMVEQLKKFAGMDTEMATLLAEYNRQHGEEQEEQGA